MKTFFRSSDDDLSSFEATKLDATHRSSKNSYEALKQSRDNERKKMWKKVFYFTTTIHRAFNVFCALNERASFMWGKEEGGPESEQCWIKKYCRIVWWWSPNVKNLSEINRKVMNENSFWCDSIVINQKFWEFTVWVRRIFRFPFSKTFFSW